MIDISSVSSDPRATRLSNVTERVFTFDGIECYSIESILQSLKEFCPEIQPTICKKSGPEALAWGTKIDGWKACKILWWNKTVYPRFSRGYTVLITRIFNAVFKQDPTFREDLLLLGDENVRHSSPNQNMSETILTEIEFLYQISRLRTCAYQEAIWQYPRYEVIHSDGTRSLETIARAAHILETVPCTAKLGTLVLEADMSVRDMDTDERQRLRKIVDMVWFTKE